MYQNERAPRPVRAREAQRRLHKDGRILPYDRARASLVRAIKFAAGDAHAIRQALIALDDVNLLINALTTAGAITDVATDALADRVDIVRKALQRFLPPRLP